MLQSLFYDLPQYVTMGYENHTPLFILYNVKKFVLFEIQDHVNNKLQFRCGIDLVYYYNRFSC